MKSLKISADVFIHQIRFQLEDKLEEVSVRLDNGIISDLETESPRKTKIRNFFKTMKIFILPARFYNSR